MAGHKSPPNWTPTKGSGTQLPSGALFVPNFFREGFFFFGQPANKRVPIIWYPVEIHWASAEVHPTKSEGWDPMFGTSGFCSFDSHPTDLINDHSSCELSLQDTRFGTFFVFFVGGGGGMGAGQKAARLQGSQDELRLLWWQAQPSGST